MAEGKKNQKIKSALITFSFPVSRMGLHQSFYAAQQDWKAILSPMILYMCTARCYIPTPPLFIALPLSQTYINYLHSASPPDWSVRSRLLAKEKKAAALAIQPHTYALPC